jgi:hypothetical protein
MTPADFSRTRSRHRGNALHLSHSAADSQSRPPASREDAPSSKPPSAQRRALLAGVRYVLPVVVVVAGLVIMALGSESDLEGGAGIISAGLAIYFLNWLYRIGVAGDRERDAEDAAREYFTRHGRWPS